MHLQTSVVKIFSHASPHGDSIRSSVSGNNVRAVSAIALQSIHIWLVVICLSMGFYIAAANGETGAAKSDL